LLSAVKTMTESLNSLVGQVQRSGILVSSSSTELAATVKQQETTMTAQVASTNKVVKSVEVISHVASELVDTMQQVASMSQETAGFATRGQEDLSRMQATMQNMENASKSISGRLETINEKAENITNVVDTITKVADQTNLLSLNAAIEAEKAGEYGRGFQVVAREIRRLADQTAVATLDIEQMVQEMQSAVSAGVMEMDKFITEVKHNAEDVGKISAQLTRIIEQVQTLSPSFEGVNVAMGHQSENAQEINTAMVNLSEELTQTLDSLRETYSAIEQLNEAARGLQDEVSHFKAD
jgi:methyl-accepting chemotaxis protein WspA